MKQMDCYGMLNVIQGAVKFLKLPSIIAESAMVYYLQADFKNVANEDEINLLCMSISKAITNLRDPMVLQKEDICTVMSKMGLVQTPKHTISTA